MKLKKVLASILALCMVLSTMGIVAFAEASEVDVWDGTVDTSWYNETDTEFTITTAEQFAGLAYLVNGAQSYNPALGNEDSADFGYYSEGHKSAQPDGTATGNSVSFEGKTIYLAADLDLCPVDANGDLVKLPGEEQLSMMPVGYSSYTPFKGTFDGQGHTIKNMFQGGWDLYGLDYNNKVNLGLFGNVVDATIKNLVVENFAFNAEMILGGVAGKSSGTSVYENITVKDSIINSSGGWYAGGLIGWAYGNQTIKDVTIEETVTVAQTSGNYDTAIGGIIGGCNNVDGESITFEDCYVACKLDVYNDCTANYDTNSYRNCGMIIGAIGEDNEIIIDGKKYPDFEAKGLTFEDVKVYIGEWANYTYCWSYDLNNNCQRIEPGVGYKGVDLSKVSDYSIDTTRPFDSIFGAENAGNLNNVRGDVDVRVMEFLGIEGVNVVDEAHLALFAAEVYKYSDITRAATLIYVNSYATLQDAINSIGATEGEYVLKVIKDIEEDVTVTQNPNQKITITGDEINKPVISGTIKIDGQSAAYATAGLTIENLVFDASAITDDTIITAGWDNNTRYISNLTVSNCDFVDETAAKAVRAIASSTGGSKNWNINNCTATGLHSLLQTKNVEDRFVVEDCVITNCKNGININSTENFTMTGTTITVDGYGVRSGENGTPDIALTFADNTINAGENAIVLRAGTENADVTITSGTYNGGAGQDAVSVLTSATVEISGGSYSSNVDAYLVDGFELTRTGNGYTVVEDTTVDDEGRDQADSISIEYKDITAADAEGEKVYEVVVKANDGDMINELASVDISFAFATTPIEDGNIAITVLPATDFAMSRYENTDRYMFNYNGTTAFEGTDNAITVATITVEGYGAYTIATAVADTNVVNATTLYDNLVDSYTAAGAIDEDTTTGGLVINEDTVADDGLVGKVENDVIAVPVRDLAVTIDFPNAITDNVIAYQDMKVVISGGDLAEDITVDLGSDAAETAIVIDGKVDAKYAATMVDGSYVINVTDALTLNNAYTVTVTGAGYRTARYTVTMTEDKALRFWNNVMDEAQVVEIGKDSSEAYVTFLAGDIVKDNKINIYDLSAVVSYFGQTNDTAAYSDYAKYDLNRDGVIDSKDVAYVLVSWDN